jgi:CrcB protein
MCGAIGCALRLVARDVLMRNGAQPWWAVLVINLFGALLMGAVAGSARSIEEQAGPMLVAAVTGVLAGWTTYSAFSMDVVQLWLRGQRASALALWAATLCGAPLLALAGGAAMAAYTGATP